MVGHFIPSASNRKQEMVAFIKKHLPSKEPETSTTPQQTLQNGLPN